MANFYIPSKGAESWKEFLAEPEKHWCTGYSAKSLAYCWEEAKGFSKCVSRVFKNSDISLFTSIEFILGIPEHKVPLPGKGYDSQTDLFVLASSNGELISMAVEGKVSEPFGDQTVAEYLDKAGENKQSRMNGLAQIIGLPIKDIFPIRYQLIHRTASALIEADRFCAKHALMLVHSFSQTHLWFEEYAAFAALYGKQAERDGVLHAGKVNGKDLYLCWVAGDKEFLTR